MDPLSVLARFQNFAQPSDVMAPMELMREGVVLQARGLMNSQAIQHNLDWIWPFWVERQFDPSDDAFVPRAFSLTQINLTHRNWTAVGIPGFSEFPIVDPRGLVTPFYDGWSLDAWIVAEGRQQALIPSRLKNADQSLTWADNLSIITSSREKDFSLVSKVDMIFENVPACRLRLAGLSLSDAPSWLVVALRPYNPEGVSFIHDISLLKEGNGWMVNGKDAVTFDAQPDAHHFSYYRQGDVFRYLGESKNSDRGTWCKVGMATAAASFELKPSRQREITVHVPFSQKHTPRFWSLSDSADNIWEASLRDVCVLKVPDEKFQFLYDAAVRTVILHSPDETYPGPYTYRRFWFRDAAFIIHAMLCVGLNDRARQVLGHFPRRQTSNGYFHSQEGEWDSNGEAIWIIRQFAEMTHSHPGKRLMDSVTKGVNWIVRKRLSERLPDAHAGLLPPGFSAEHLGPNDYYFWDNFWALSGLQAACSLEKKYGSGCQIEWERVLESYKCCVEKSLEHASRNLGSLAMPASPYRRMDSGAVGSLAAGYPLRIFSCRDSRLLETAEYLLNNCSFENGFFHDMTHSGVNPYLTLHIAQVLLRAGDPRYFSLMKAVADLASSTGQWPEAVHPRTRGGCMGDGQHVWAAAEWILMMRNCFVREEESCLVLASGIPEAWLKPGQDMFFGSAPTCFGPISVTIRPTEENVEVEWDGRWFDREPDIRIHLPGFSPLKAERGSRQANFDRRKMSI